jgi:hypothetical protein
MGQGNCGEHTLTLGITPVDTYTSKKNIVDD